MNAADLGAIVVIGLIAVPSLWGAMKIVRLIVERLFGGDPPHFDEDIFHGLVVALLLTVPAAASPPANADPDLAPWFRDLHSPLGMSCCDQADGHILADRDWRPAGDGYEVRVADIWVPVPPEAVLERVDNPTGGAVVFYPPSGAPPIFCFVRPAET